MSKKFVYQYKIHIAIILFLVMFFAFHYMKPAFAYMDDGSYRKFGIGYRNFTILPIWLVSILLAIISYLLVFSFLLYA
jgi:hypothetical protein